MIWIVSACLFTLLMIVMATSCSAEAVTEVMADDWLCMTECDCAASIAAMAAL